MPSRLGIFRGPITVTAEKVSKVKKACVTKNNFLLNGNGEIARRYCPTNFAGSECPLGERLSDWRRKETNTGAFENLTNFYSCDPK